MSDLSIKLRAEIQHQIDSAGFERIMDVCRRALIAARRHQDREAEAVALYGLAAAYRYTGRYQEARVFNESGALPLAHELQHDELIVDATVLNGDIWLMGSFQVYDARNFYDDALKIARTTRYQRGITESLIGLAAVFASMEMPKTARPYALECLQSARDMDAPALQVRALNVAGAVLLRENDPETALQCHQTALGYSRTHQYKLLETITLYYLGNAYRTLKKPDEALKFYEEALEITHKTGNVETEYLLWGAIGDMHLEQNHYATSDAAFERMMKLASHLDNPLHEAFALLRTGRLAFANSEYVDALDDFSRMLTLTREKNNPVGEGMALEWMALTLSRQHEYDQALETLQLSREVYLSLEDETSLHRTTGTLIMLYVMLAWHKVLRFLRLR